MQENKKSVLRVLALHRYRNLHENNLKRISILKQLFKSQYNKFLV